MNELIKQFKAELRKLATIENKAIEIYKNLALIGMELASIEAVSKKILQDTIKEVLEKRGLSESSIKKIRGNIMSFYEGAKKFPEKIEMIKIRLNNINSRQEFEKLAKAFKKEGATELSQKSSRNSPKNKNYKVEIIEGEETLDKSRYYKIISSIIKINEDDFYKLDDDKIVQLFDEVQKISKIIGGIKG